ncbi:tumor necrosis factor ligand superfamily member 4 [Nycticebus coucang]|uniref:tumor necrosis factor ligand superfamily member 4 n=1 Tax=Nycticebus coucang TaxID=9470 RepID=UPI00234DC714|nr:tumor necrosis factor ligand superfamily member 4 [Nycticebus coucang]
MEGVQPLDENVGNMPWPRVSRNKLLLVATWVQGLGLLLCFAFICLHYFAPQLFARTVGPNQSPANDFANLNYTENPVELVEELFLEQNFWVHNPVQSIRVQLTKYEKEKGFIIISQNQDEIMKVENNSIVINCDGFYLVSMKGYFSQEVNVSLHYRQKEDPLILQSKARSVNAIVVVSLRYKDKVYLNVTTDHRSSYDDLYVNGGELILIQQNPGGYCAP